MQSEVMGKTLAIFMVIAMITTGIALLPTHARAGELYTVTGTVVDDVTSQPIGGVKVTISNATVNKNITTLSTGIFTLYVEPGNYSVTFEKVGYLDGNTTVVWSDFNQTSKKALVGTRSIIPLPSVSGIVKDLGTSATIDDVEVTVKNSATGAVIDQVMSDNGVFSAPVDTTEVDIYFKKNGYYDNSNEDVTLATYGVTNLGDIYLEKIVPTPTIKVWGIVKVTGTDNTLADAVISISAGDDKMITTISDSMGYFEMLAYTGSFQISGSLTGYYTSAPEWFNVPSDGSIRHDIVLEKTPVETQVITGIITGEGTPLVGADVYLHSTDGKYVNHTSTVAGGAYTMMFYVPPAGVSFMLEVSNESYFTNVDPTLITGNTTRDVDLTKIVNVHTLRGFIYDIDNEMPLVNATVTIYSKDYLYTQTTQSLSNGYYEFMVHNFANYTIAVNAEGYQSEVRNADNIIANRYVEVGLYLSDSDVVTTTYTFVDWNIIQVTKNKVISVDNVTVRLNADRRYGMEPVGLTLNDCDLDAADITRWTNDLEDKGAEKRDTKEFLTLNNTYYTIDLSSYDVSIEGAEGPVSDEAVVYINSSYNYNITDTLENVNSTIFTMVLNATYDTEFVDYTNDIILPLVPKKFEMTRNITETSYVEVLGYNNPITVNPEIYDSDSEKVTMTLQFSNNGTAKASVINGVHYVMNSTYDNYTVMVPKGPISDVDTNITFSAEGSTDKIGDITKANFTWNFGDGAMGYGMEVKHDFTTTDGELLVKLVVTETGGNKTWRNITVFVDSRNPVAGISAITTDSDNISYSANVLTVNEDISITFSGVKFTDTKGVIGTETIVGVPSSDEITSADGGDGIIEKWYWSWGEDDVSDETITKDGINNITHTFSNPGTYTLTLKTTDVVGRESTNATWTVHVKDVTKPVTDFNIKDSSKVVVTEVVENGTYQYNASLTSDNYDDVENLTFVWTFDVDGTVTNKTGMSVNFTFAMVGDFNVTVNATDVAGNYYSKTTKLHVNLAERPNILMKLGSMVFSETPGTAGSKMTISVNITNDGEANATDIQTKFYIRNADGTDKEIGTETTSFLAIGNTTTVTIDWTPSKKGEFSIWANSTCAGEHSSQWWDNKIDDFSVQKVTVEEAAWVMPAIIIGVIVVIIVVFVGMKYFMKSGTEKEATGDKRKKR